MKLSETLTALGLSKTEAGVYMDLLEYGTQTISEISRTSKLHRPAIYASLPTLKEKGLISERQIGKLIHYAAEPPERLRNLVHALHEDLDTIIPNLTELQDNKRPHVRRLDGRAGVHAVYEDILQTLNKGEAFYRYSSESSADAQKVGLPPNYEERRDKKEIGRLVITNSDYIASREPDLDETLVEVPEEYLPFNDGVSQIIYGSKIAFIDYNIPMATIIDNPTVAKFQKDVFMMLFRQLRRQKRQQNQ